MQISSGVDLKIEFQEGSPTVVDEYPLRLSYRVPAVRFTAEAAGLRDLPRGNYRVGFIQYITKYEFKMRYRKTLLEVAIPCPVSDSSPPSSTSEAGYDRDSFGNDYENPCSYPWNAPPVIFGGNPGRLRQPFAFVRPYTTDAPQGRVNWFYPGRASVPESLVEENPLESVSRFHHFVTCLVLWNETTQAVVELLAKAEWDHDIDLLTDASRRAGERVQCFYVKPQPVKQVRELAGFTIPPAALAAPCANEEADRCLRVSNNPDTLYVGFGSGLNPVPTKRDLLNRPRPKGRRPPTRR